jgi:pyrroline-5-carboxylate reductase
MRSPVQVEFARLSDRADVVRVEGGTTIYGLEVMEKAAVRAALMQTIAAATNRAVQLES